MISAETTNCCCATGPPQPKCSLSATGAKSGWRQYLPWGIAGWVVWWLVYQNLAPFAAWLTYSLLPLSRGSHLGGTVEFFVYESPKVLMLLTLVVFGVGIVRSFFTPERTRLQRHIEDWVFQTQAGEAGQEEQTDWPARIRLGVDAVKDIVGRVWLCVIIGIGVGAGIHGYVPANFMASIMGKGAWWSVPLAVLIGVPMYSNAAGIIPIVQALLGKGAALGTVLAFMMSVIALSLPEAIILRKVLKPRLIAAFFGVVALGILIVGYLFNLIM
jgi:uncharacterized membrane protein YraQ (UPF0718 family)